MNWIILVIAGLFEVGFATCLAKARGTSGLVAIAWWTGFGLSLFLSMYLLYRATLTIPVGTAYAVWTGIGAAGTAIMGMIFFREPADFWRVFFIATLICSVVGLKWASH